MTTRKNGSDALLFRQGYDLKNRLVDADADGDADADLRLAYDHQEGRVARHTLDGSGAVTASEHYLLDRMNPTGYEQVLEQAATLDASPARSFVLGLSLILQADGGGGGTLRSLLFDGHGTARGLVDATGRIASGQILAYDAFGVRTDAHSAVLTPIQYTGQWFDEVLGQGYHRHRWLEHGTGSWNAYDRYEGSWLEPISLAKYFYANASPIHFTDSSGMFSFAELMVTVGIQAFIGAALGVGINAVNNYAHGRALTYGAYQAALAGALLAPAALAFPLLGLGLAGYGIFSASHTVSTVFANPDSTVGQKAAAVALLGLSIFGGAAAAKNAKLGGFWRETPGGGTAAALDQVHARPMGQPQPTLRSVPRTQRDLAVNPTPPAANNGPSTIGGNANQAAALQRYITQLKSMGAKDIRVNQQQVNINNQRVGVNRPDLQFTYDGRRWYIEWDTSKSLRGIPHGERIMANDPDGMTLLFNLD